MGDAAASKTPAPPPSEAFPAVVPRVSSAPAKRGDHKPTRSSPLAAKQPPPPPPPPVFKEDPSSEEDHETSEDEIAKVEKLTAKRGEALNAMEEALGKVEKHLRTSLASLEKSAKESMQVQSSRLASLGTVLSKEEDMVREAKERTLSERRVLMELHVDEATRETESMARELEDKANALLEQISKGNRRSCRPLFLLALFIVVAGALLVAFLVQTSALKEA